MIAVMNNRHEMVTLLLSLGADMEIMSNKDETALVFAVNEQNPVIVETLVRAGANVNHLDSTRENLLLRAVRMHRADVLRALLSHTTNISVSTDVIDSAFEEVVMQPKRTLLDFQLRGHEGIMVKQLYQAKRIDMIGMLIPMVSDGRLVLNPTVFCSCMHLHTNEANTDYHTCDLLLRYGFAYSNDHVRLLLSNVNPYRMSFARLLILTSDNRPLLRRYMKRSLQTQLIICPEIGQMYKTLRFVIRALSNPLSLQDLCVITARTRLRGRMWSKIDSLPLPPLLKDKLKLLWSCVQLRDVTEHVQSVLRPEVCSLL